MVSMENISKNYDSRKVLHNISLRAFPGEIVCLLGPSGCGKTTLLNIISGTLSPSSGTLRNNSRTISYVFQEDRLLPWRTALENVRLVQPESSREKCLDLLKCMGLQGFEKAYPDELSGGMRQRCAIARGFNYAADLMLMDEPLKSLDYSLRFSIIHHLLHLWESTRRTIFFVTHEIDEALLLGDRIYVLSSPPTEIRQEFPIKENKRNRRLTDSNLIAIRSGILDLLQSFSPPCFS